MKLANKRYLITFEWEYCADPRLHLRVRGESHSPRPDKGRVEFIDDPDCWLTFNGKILSIRRHDGNTAILFPTNIAKALLLAGEWKEL